MWSRWSKITRWLDTPSVSRYRQWLVQLRLPDGSVHEYLETIPADAPDLDLQWYYTDGSLACDCNRSFLLRRAGVDIPVYPCGRTIQLLALERLSD